MSRPTRLTLLTTLLALGLVARGRAQSADAKPADPSVFQDPAKAEATADTPLPVPAKPARPRRATGMSDDLKATLAVGMPTYNPPKPPEKKPDLPPEPSEESDANKPRNGIIRLPDYVVREKRPPVFKERELATPDRKADLAIKQNPGLNFGPFASLNRPIGLAMYQEQERLDGMADLADEARTARRAGDKASADYITRQSQQTYIHRDDNLKTYGIGPK